MPPKEEGSYSEIVDIDISLNVNVTNTIISRGHANPEQAITSAYATLESDQTGQERAVFGSLSNVNSVSFERVPLVVPGDGTTLKLYVKNLRCNASQLGVPLAVKGAPKPLFPNSIVFGFETELGAFVSIRESANSEAPIEVVNSICSLARPILGLTTHARSLHDEYVEIDTQLNPGVEFPDYGPPELTFVVEVGEGFNGAFRSCTSERRSAPIEERPKIHGTRFLARLYNVPTGIRVFATCTDVIAESNGVNAMLVKGADSNGFGGDLVHADASIQKAANSSEGPMFLEELDVSSGYAMSCWEWVNLCRSDSEDCRKMTLGFVLAAPDGGSSPGCTQVSVTLAPTTTVTVSDSSNPVPRFIDTAGDPETIFCVLSPEDPEEDHGQG